MKSTRSLCAALLVGLLSFYSPSQAASETLVLSNGSSLVGEVVSEQGGKITFKDSVLGTLTLEASAVKERHASTGSVAAAPAAAVVAAAPMPVASHAAGRTPEAGKPVWTRGLQFNLSHISGAAPAFGVDATTNIGVSMMIERATKENIASFGGSYNRSRSRPSPASVDNLTLGFQFDHIYTDKLRVIAKSTYLVDKPKKINHRFEQLVGTGLTLIKTPKSFLLVAPGLGYSRGSKEFVGLDEDHFGYGAYMTASHAFTPALSIEQHAFYFGAFRESDYYVYNGYVGFRGQVTPKIAMTLGYNVVHDNQMAPGIEKTEYQILSGLQFKF